MNEHHDETTTLEQLPPLLRLIVENLDKFNGFLVPSGNVEAKLLLPSGPIEPLGFHRLKIIEFFAILARTNYKCIDNVIVKLNVLNTCLVRLSGVDFNLPRIYFSATCGTTSFISP